MGKNKQTKTEFICPVASLKQQVLINALIKDQSNIICQTVAINPDVKIFNLTFNRDLNDSHFCKIKALKLQKTLASKTFNLLSDQQYNK